MANNTLMVVLIVADNVPLLVVGAACVTPAAWSRHQDMISLDVNEQMEPLVADMEIRCSIPGETLYKQQANVVSHAITIQETVYPVATMSPIAVPLWWLNGVRRLAEQEMFVRDQFRERLPRPPDRSEASTQSA